MENNQNDHLRQIRKYTAAYRVQGVRFFMTPRVVVYTTNIAEAELSMICKVQARYPGKQVTLSNIKECQL